MKRQIGQREAETSGWVKQLGGKNLRKSGLKHLSSNAPRGKLWVAVWWFVTILAVLAALFVIFLAWQTTNPFLVLLGVLIVAVPVGVSAWLGKLWSKHQMKTASFGDELERLGFPINDDSYGVDWGFKRPVQAFVDLHGRIPTSMQLEGLLAFLRRSLAPTRGSSWFPVLGEDYGGWLVFEISSDSKVLADSEIVVRAWSAFNTPTVPITVGRDEEGSLAAIWVKSLADDPRSVVTEGALVDLFGGRWAAEWLPDSQVMQYKAVDDNDPIFLHRELLPSVELCVSTAASHNLSAADRVYLADVNWVDEIPKVITILFDTPEIADPVLRDSFIGMLTRNLSFTFPGTEWSESWGRNGNQPVLFMSNNTV